MSRSKPDRPCVPTTMSWTARAAASRRIASTVGPSVTTRSTATPAVSADVTNRSSSASLSMRQRAASAERSSGSALPSTAATPTVNGTLNT